MTEILRTAGGADVSRTDYTFFLRSADQSLAGSGREAERVDRDAAGNALRKTATTWRVDATANGTSFVHPQWVEEYTREGGGLPAAPQKKTYYEYNTALQGGAQYGNPTLVQEHLAGNLYRQIETTYYPNAGLWIVDKPALVTLKDGNGRPDGVTAVAIDQVGELLAYANQDGAVRIDRRMVDDELDCPVSFMRPRLGQGVRGLQFDPERRYLAILHEQDLVVVPLTFPSIHLWKAEAEIPPAAHRSVAFGPRGDVLAIASDQGWELRRTSDLRVLACQEGDGGTAVAFSPDGAMLAIGHADGSVELLACAW